MRDYTDIKIKVKDWLKLLKAGKFYLDLGFQSRGRWAKADRKLFLYNLSSKLAPSKLIVCNIKESLLHIEPHFDSDGKATNTNYTYFKDLQDMGYEYIIIDGNNRDITLLAFLGHFQSWNELGEYEMLNIDVAEAQGLFDKNSAVLPKTGWIHKNVDTKPYFDKFRLNKDQPYSRLSLEHKEMFDDIELTIAVYWTDEVNDLGEIFNAVNTGCDLNAQEMRNAWVRYKITKMVREFTSDNTTALSSISGIKFLRRHGDELVAQFHAYSTQDKDINQSELNLLYEHDQITEWSKTVKHAKLTFDILKEIGFKTVKSNHICRGHVLDLYDLIKTLDNESYKIDNKKFAAWWSDTLHRLRKGDLVNDKWYISAQQETDYATYLSGTVMIDYEPLIQEYNASILEVGKRYGRGQRKNKWFELLMTANNVDEIITFTDSRRIYTHPMTYQIWLNQDKKSLKTGNEILLSDLFNKEKYQTDHIIDHAKGGLTTIENGEVMEIEHHKEKTKNTWFPQSLSAFGPPIETVTVL